MLSSFSRHGQSANCAGHRDRGAPTAWQGPLSRSRGAKGGAGPEGKKLCLVQLGGLLGGRGDDPHQAGPVEEGASRQRELFIRHLRCLSVTNGDVEVPRAYMTR